TEAQMASRRDGRPFQPLDGDVLAEGAGYDRVSLGTELVDRLHGVEADGPLRSAVVLHVAVGVALEAQGGHPCRGDRRLRDAARRDADLYDSSVHSRPPWRARGRVLRLSASGPARRRGARHPAHFPARRIMRWTRASSTSSPRWFRTRGREVTMPPAGLFVSCLASRSPLA